MLDMTLRADFHGISFVNMGSGTRAPRGGKEADFKEVLARLARWKFPEAIDGVVGIAQNGIVPAALVAQRLNVGLKTITIAYRNNFLEPQFPEPQLVSSVPGLGGWRRILLVDDVWLTGSSWNTARTHLPKNLEVFPFVLSGKVEHALFPNLDRQPHWPWLA